MALKVTTISGGLSKINVSGWSVCTVVTQQKVGVEIVLRAKHVRLKRKTSPQDRLISDLRREVSNLKTALRWHKIQTTRWRKLYRKLAA